MILARELKKQDAKEELKKCRIGLALSGGGFRAAIFHLGVIRRLEELGIMHHVDVISAVSGGSIISAYYICEMERLLREKEDTDRTKIEVRVELFEKIAEKFFEALDKNLRTRALIFTPFYHPWLFIKTLFLKPFRATARSALIQREYDKFFFEKNTLDQLPSTASGKKQENEFLLGSKLLLNTTSLLTGERVSFSREPISGVKEMSEVDRNVLPLSQVVGASSGVPGLFPPTMISGDVLVDGGVADNQGIESLIDDPVNCNVLLVSDASGQMETQDTIGLGVLTILARVNSVLQFQVRNKLLDILVSWKRLMTDISEERRFAFIHLFLNLKDRINVSHRISSEFIPAIARIRTDLDQFSYIEREALMYHGYTLMDAQIRKYCCDALNICDELCGFPDSQAIVKMKTPPLFKESVARNLEACKVIRKDLEAGSQNVYLIRCLKKYFWATAPVITAGVAVAFGLMVMILHFYPQCPDWVATKIYNWLACAIPGFIAGPVTGLLHLIGLSDISGLIRMLCPTVSFLVLLFLVLYIVTFPVYEVVRHIALIRDRSVYKKLTGRKPSVNWDEIQEEKSLSSDSA